MEATVTPDRGRALPPSSWRVLAPLRLRQLQIPVGSP